MTNSADYSPVVCSDIVCTILSGATESDAKDLRGTMLLALDMPGTFTGTAITFLHALEIDGTFKQVTVGSTGNAYTVTVAANKTVTVDPFTFAGLRFLKVKSGSAEGADREVTLLTRPV
jgi:hypothetical protein